MRRLVFESLEDRALLSSGSGHLSVVGQSFASPSGMIGPAIEQVPPQILGAYGIGNIQIGPVVGTGAGQTIAIIDAFNEPTITSDLAAYDAEYGFSPPPSFQVLNQTGGTSPLPITGTSSWLDEEAMDVEWAHTVAPQANIILFEATSAAASDLLTAELTARSWSGVSVVSMSWGFPESYFSAFNFSTLDSTYFTTPAARTGVTFLASTGDNSAPVEYPSTSPNVVAVGGTSLTTSGNNYVSETGWSNSVGGPSSYESKPTYQSSVQSSSKREVPDVAFDADPNTAVPIYVQGSWIQYGGTSLACACWAGLIAVAANSASAWGEPR